MEDVEVFPRQAVIVKNGKIFVEDEPFFCSGAGDEDGDNNSGDDAGEGKSDADKPTSASTTPAREAEDPQDDGRPDHVDSNKTDEVDGGRGGHSVFDDFESEKENRISQDFAGTGRRHIFYHHHHHHYHHDEDEEEDSDGEDGDEEERFLSLVDREEFFEDVDGLRLQGLPDSPLEGFLQGLPDGPPPDGLRLQAFPPQGPLDPAEYLDYIT